MDVGVVSGKMVMDVVISDSCMVDFYFAVENIVKEYGRVIVN